MRTTRRTVAVVGAMVAVAASTLMGIAATTASAATPGRCLENVNVRAEPSMDARIVAVCEAGTAVQTESTRNGFVRLSDLRGWASAEYIAIDGAPAGRPRSEPAPGTTTEDTEDTDAPTTTPGTRNTRPGGDVEERRGSGDDAGESGEDGQGGQGGQGDEPREAVEPAAPAGGPLGGLL